MIHLTDEALKQHITETEVMLRGLRVERQAREQRLAESLLPGFAEKVLQYFGAEFTVRVGTGEYDYDVFFEIDVPSSVSVDDLIKMEDRLFADSEVLDKFLGGSLFVITRFVK